MPKSRPDPASSPLLAVPSESTVEKLHDTIKKVGTTFLAKRRLPDYTHSEWQATQAMTNSAMQLARKGPSDWDQSTMPSCFHVPKHVPLVSMIAGKPRADVLESRPLLNLQATHDIALTGKGHWAMPGIPFHQEMPIG